MEKGLRLFCVILALSLLISFTFGCSSKSDTTQNPNVSTSKPAEKQEIVKFKQLYVNPQPYFTDGGIVREEFRKRIGVDIETMLPSGGGEEYKSKLNVLLASGDYPDYFYAPDVVHLSQLVSQGVARSLDDLLKNVPNVMKVVPQESWKYMKTDGKTWGIPVGYRPEAFNGPNINALKVRGDWLTKLNIKEPETLDDFKKMLEAFRDKDPDGNGKKDTIPLTGYAAYADSFDFIFGAFDTIPDQWVQRDGKVQMGFTTPEFKEAVKFIADIYKEGLLDKEFLLMKNETNIKDKIIQGLVGVHGGKVWGVMKESEIRRGVEALGGNLKPMKPPAGPKGKRGFREANAIGSFLGVFSSKIKNPERLMSFIDYICTEEGANLAQYGIEGPHYTYDKAANKINRLIDDKEIMKNGAGNAHRLLQVTDRRWADDLLLQSVGVAQTIIKNEFFGSVPAFTEFPGISKVIDEQTLKVIIGEVDISAIDKAVAQWNKEGGEKITQQVNEAWKKMNVK